MTPLRNFVEVRAKQSKTGLLILADLNYELKIVGIRFLVFAILFYVGIPVIYYWLNLGWSLIDSLYVSIVNYIYIYICIVSVICIYFASLSLYICIYLYHYLYL